MKKALLTISNSYSTIRNLNAIQLKSLRKKLSYQTDAQMAFFSNSYQRTISLVDKRGAFPTGLLTDVVLHLKELGTDYTWVRSQERPTALVGRFKLKSSIKPYPDQEASAATAQLFSRGTISACTGYGKSYMIALLVERLQLRTLIIVPSVELKTQLTATMRAYFGGLKDITIDHIGSTALKTAADYDCLILDEIHHAAAKTYHRLNKTAWAGIYHRFGFTGTPFRNQEHEQLLYKAIAGDVIYEVTYRDAVEQKAIVPIESYYIEVPKTKVRGEGWAQVYKELVVSHEHRNELIATLLLRLNAAGKSTLCLVKEVAHGQLLTDLTGIPFANGKDDITREFIRDFKSGRIGTLIATAGICGEGVDTKPAEYVVIAGLGKAKSAFMQQVGRVVRQYKGKESGKVIILKDLSHKWTKSHFSTQTKILIDEYGSPPVKLDL